MADTTGAVKGNKKLTSGSSEYNAEEFHIRNTILNTVNTAIPVIVTAVDAGGHGSATGYVTIKPLVCQVDGFGEALEPAELFKVPYSRIQGGVAALVIDPIVGDIGLAVFAKSDCSNVQQEQSKTVQPGSFRKYSMSDGFYIGGFLNRAPSVYVEVGQESITINATANVTINAPSGATVNAPTVDINASSSVNLNTPLVQVAGQLVQTGESATGATMRGGITNIGGTISSNGIVLDSHVHGGVESGGSTTSGPQ